MSKKMKKIISVLITISMIMTLSVAVAATEETPVDLITLLGDSVSVTTNLPFTATGTSKKMIAPDGILNSEIFTNDMRAFDSQGEFSGSGLTYDEYYVQIALPASYPITEVKITVPAQNADWYTGLCVYASATMDFTDCDTLLTQRSSDDYEDNVVTISLSGEKSYRYIRIMKKASSPLTLRGIAIKGYNTPTYPTVNESLLTELSAAPDVKVTTNDGIYYNNNVYYSPQRIVDGDPATYAYTKEKDTAPSGENYRWYKIDLQRAAQLCKLVLTPRMDSSANEESRKYFEILASDTADFSTYDVLFSRQSKALDQEAETIYVDSSKSYRYIMIKKYNTGACSKEGTNYLGAADLQVYGYEGSLKVTNLMTSGGASVERTSGRLDGTIATVIDGTVKNGLHLNVDEGKNYIILDAGKSSAMKTLAFLPYAKLENMPKFNIYAGNNLDTSKWEITDAVLVASVDTIDMWSLNLIDLNTTEKYRYIQLIRKDGETDTLGFATIRVLNDNSGAMISVSANIEDTKGAVTNLVNNERTNLETVADVIEFNFSKELDETYLKSDNITITSSEGAVNYQPLKKSATTYVIDPAVLNSETAYTVNFKNLLNADGDEVNEMSYEFKTAKILPIPYQEGKKIINAAYKSKTARTIHSDYTSKSYSTLLVDGTESEKIAVAGGKSENYFTIDLGNYYDVKAIEIFTRGNCKNDTMNVQVKIDTLKKNTPADYTTTYTVGNTGLNSESGNYIDISDATARYVALYRDTNGLIVLREVKVYVQTDVIYGGNCTQTNDTDASWNIWNAVNDNGNCTITLPVTNLSGNENAKCVLIAAAYDAEGKIVDIEKAECNVSDAKITINTSGAATIKVAAVDSLNSLIMLCDPLEKTFE